MVNTTDVSPIQKVKLLPSNKSIDFIRNKIISVNTLPTWYRITQFQMYVVLLTATNFEFCETVL